MASPYTVFTKRMLSSEGYLVKTLTAEEKKELTAVPWTPPTSTHRLPRFNVYRRVPEGYLLPPQYAFQRYGKIPYTDAGNVVSITVPFKGTLRESQESTCRTAIDALREKGGAILSLYTGYGKTCCALFIASMMNVRTAIVVHKTNLLDQWRDRIERFLPTARVGFVQGQRADYEDKDIILLMLQTTIRRDIDFTSVGLVIVDETHHVAAKVFSTIFSGLNRPYMLGLSATIERKDRLQHIIEWYIGPVAVNIALTVPETSVVRIVHPPIQYGPVPLDAKTTSASPASSQTW